MKLASNIKIYLLIFLCILLFKNSFSQNTNDCHVYLNFPCYSFEITGGFSQVYKISSRYNLFSRECNAFLDFIFTKPVLNQYLFDDNKNECDIYYKKFFERCRCDTTSFLFIYTIPEKSVISDKTEVFNKKIFDTSLHEISDSAVKALDKAFPGYKIEIKFSSATRSIKEQENYFIKGSSSTLLSAHILGAAADFTIYFNGILIDPTPGAKSLFKSFEPYQVLGKFILEKGYFWGIPWDPGHMQLKRKMEDILMEYPDLQSDGNLMATYCNIIKEDSIPLKYKPVIDILDKKFGFKGTRTYNPSQPWVNDDLLLPLNADTLSRRP